MKGPGYQYDDAISERLRVQKPSLSMSCIRSDQKRQLSTNFGEYAQARIDCGVSPRRPLPRNQNVLDDCGQVCFSTTILVCEVVEGILDCKIWAESDVVNTKNFVCEFLIFVRGFDIP